MQWTPALLLILPASLVALAAWRPGPIRVLVAVIVMFLLDLAALAAFSVQPEWRTREDTIRLILFVAVPAGLITLLTLIALARLMAQLWQEDQ